MKSHPQKSQAHLGLFRNVVSPLLAGALVCSTLSPAAAAPPGTGWTLTYAEEFNSTMPSVCNSTGVLEPGWLPTDWYTNHTMGDANTWFCFPGIDTYNPFSIYAAGLRITAVNQARGGKTYSSGWLTTARGYAGSGNLRSTTYFHQKYGYFEARCKLPTGAGKSKGMWPAFWLLPASDAQSAAEYDIFEVLGNAPTKIHQTAHWNDYGNRQHFEYIGPDTSTGYHVYGFEWDATNIKWYVDGVLTQTQPNRYNGEMFVNLDLAVGGSWPGAPDANTVFPAYMDVDYVRVYAKNVALPSPWASQDIGSVGRGGTASHSSGAYTVRASGADIWGSADSFRYVYQTASGDCEIRARVSWQQNSNSSAKAGVMMREGVASNARNVIMAVTPTQFSFQYRTAAGGATTLVSGGAINTAPNNWVRLVKTGNTIVGYKSSNGTTWTQVGSISIPMTVNIGMAACAHNNTVLAGVKFDSVTATP